MRKFEILRYIKRFSALIVLFALLGSLGIYSYGKKNQRYTAKATIQYTNDGIVNGYTPNGSDLDVGEIYSTIVIANAMDQLGLTGTPELIRSQCGVIPVVPEDQQKLNEALTEKGEELTYFPDRYEIVLTVDGKYGEDYARNLLDSIIESYFSWYTENYVEHRLSLRPSNQLLDKEYDYYQCITMLDNDTKEMMDFLAAKQENFPEFRSTKTGYSFRDLYEIYQEINRYELAALYAQVISGPHVRNQDYLIKTLQDEIKQSENLETVRLERTLYLKDLIENFSDKNKDIMDYHYGMSQYYNRNSEYILKDVYENRDGSDVQTTYDALILEYVGLNKAIEEDAIQRDNTKYFLNVLRKGQIDPTSDHSQMEAAIENYERKLLKYYDLVNETSKELNRQLSANYIQVKNSVLVNEAISINKYVVLAVVVFLIVGVLGAIVLGRGLDFLDYLLYVDKKTGTWNRERCDVFLSQMTNLLLPDNYTSFMMEITNLTDLTKRYGYSVGNNVLSDFAGLLNACVGGANGELFHNNRGIFLGFMDKCSEQKAKAVMQVLEEHINQYNTLNGEYGIEYRVGYATTTESDIYEIRHLVNAAIENEKSSKKK